MRAIWFAAIACLVVLLHASFADAAFAVPPIQGHLTDIAGVLLPEERTEIEQRLSRMMDESGAEIAVFLPNSLEGETIEDVAYKTFNAWRIGREKLDNGVLLVLAPNEHRMRIETGKGIGGQLTDLQASDIIEHRIAPHLREGHYQTAIDDGVDGIATALGGQPLPAGRPQAQRTPKSVMAIGLIVFLVIALMMRMRRGSRFFSWGGPGGGGGWGGGGWRGGGGGGGGGGGYSGGGGRSGGGGASGGW